MNIPLDEIRRLATEILSENHALHADMLQEGILAYLEEQRLAAAEKAMRAYLAKERKYHKHHASFPHLDDVPEPEDHEYTRVSSLTIPETLLDRLPALEKQVLDMRLGLNGSLARSERATARRLNVPKSTVHDRFTRAVKMLQDLIRAPN